MKNRCLYLLCLLLAGCTPVIEETDFGLYKTVRQKGSPELSYRPESGVTILKVDDHPFKDLNKNGRSLMKSGLSFRTALNAAKRLPRDKR